ncbi:MAG: FtsX-like permease family protein, partial [Microbacterium sp.]
LTEQLSSIALQFPDGTDSAGATLESGPEETATWLWLVLAGTAVLVVGASAVALGLSRVERRSDDATLAAVGGAPRLRRSVTFWQGLIITGSGCLTGAVTGILPVLGSVMISSRSGIDLSMADVPWFFLAVLGVGLPLALAAASWLVPPRRSDLSRRTAIS